MSKRGNGEGSIYQHKDGRWIAQLAYCDADGRYHRPTRSADTRAGAARKLQALQQDRLDGLATVASARMTLSAYGRLWINETLTPEVALGRLSVSTLASYQAQWDRHVEPQLGRFRLDELSARHIRVWLAAKSQETSVRGRPLSARTVQYLHAILRRACSDAVRDGLIRSNPALKVAPPRVRRTPIQPLSRVEAAAVLAAAPNEEQKTLWLFLLGSGLRIGEALALTWSDVDLDARRVSVNRSVRRIQGTVSPTTGLRESVVVLKVPKTESSLATVGLPATVVAALREHRRRQLAIKVASVVWGEGDLVFPTSVGTYQDSSNVLKIFKAAAVDAGLTRSVRVHDLRHSAASLLVAAGQQMKVIQHQLRHSRMATTSDLYAHVLEEVAMEAADAMDEQLAGLGGA